MIILNADNREQISKNYRSAPGGMPKACCLVNYWSKEDSNYKPKPAVAQQNSRTIGATKRLLINEPGKWFYDRTYGKKNWESHVLLALRHSSETKFSPETTSWNYYLSKLFQHRLVDMHVRTLSLVWTNIMIFSRHSGKVIVLIEVTDERLEVS